MWCVIDVEYVVDMCYVVNWYYFVVVIVYF